MALLALGLGLMLLQEAPAVPPDVLEMKTGKPQEGVLLRVDEEVVVLGVGTRQKEYAAKKVVKLALIFIALIFVALQVLSYMQVVTIDWSRFLEIVNDFILNLKENQTIGEILKDRIPTAGALIGGYALGFRKG